jgi:hypothetical protein
MSGNEMEAPGYYQVDNALPGKKKQKHRAEKTAAIGKFGSASPSQT